MATLRPLISTRSHPRAGFAGCSVMSQEPRLFTSESVSEGHPDKVCDQISDAVLDAALASDPNSRVACETLTSRGLVVCAGEITTDAYIDVQSLAREVIHEIGYNDPSVGFDSNSCAVLTAIGEQSADIALGVDAHTSQSKEQGAGDQGMMFGYACRETDVLMPFPIHYSAPDPGRRWRPRRARVGDYDVPASPTPRVTADAASTTRTSNPRRDRRGRGLSPAQSATSVSDDELKGALRAVCRRDVLPAETPRRTTLSWFLNPTGRFVEGGPKADAGLTGRKIIVDTYGGMGRHGGGAFSGKDPSKVDRSAVLHGFALRREKSSSPPRVGRSVALVQLAYAIGVAEPVSIGCDSFEHAQSRRVPRRHRV